MMTYNFSRIFKARGISKPYTYLKKAGFSENFATKIKNDRAKRLNLSEIERLCILLKCTPNDITEWIPQGEQLPDTHPLHYLKHTEQDARLQEALSSIPLNKMEEITELIKNSSNNKSE